MDMSEMCKEKLSEGEYSDGDKVTCECKCTIKKSPDGKTSMDCTEMSIEADEDGDMKEGFDKAVKESSDEE